MGISKILSMEPNVQNDTLILKKEGDNDKLNKFSEENTKFCDKNCALKESVSMSKTKIQLSFSVDRLLSNVRSEEQINFDKNIESCCEEQSVSCCMHPNCLLGDTSTRRLDPKPYEIFSLSSNEISTKINRSDTLEPFTDYASKCVVRPLPIRALSGNSCDSAAPHCLPFSTLATTTLFRLQQQQRPIFQQPQNLSYSSTAPATNIALSPLLMTPLSCSLKSLQVNLAPQNQNQKQQHFRQSPMSPNHFSKAKLPNPIINPGHYHPLLHQMNQPPPQQSLLSQLQLGNHSTNAPTINIDSHHNNAPGNSNNSINTNTTTNNNNNNSNNNNNNHISNGKRKRSWSRAVFSNLQRKGLEIQFQQQKYITKPDRRKLAARLNLTDAQVKVWFQNRRMKWRHTRENLKSGHEKQPSATEQAEGGNSRPQPHTCAHIQPETDYSSDGSDYSMVIDGNDDEGEIDVVE